ncbi:uncharacterized protein LOC131229520 isoform X8 [Magnolia sinica]|uniref:uncharacterized protein LOC131229520 isoform X8 n=1 Tax=Magnolia sinica TaxID=86752 RepID=UPI002658EC56|nr:uncharacterized protein LOC131229520 isoform X8 [Magnolia sinica]
MKLEKLFLRHFWNFFMFIKFAGDAYTSFYFHLFDLLQQLEHIFSFGTYKLISSQSTCHSYGFYLCICLCSIFYILYGEPICKPPTHLKKRQFIQRLGTQCGLWQAYLQAFCRSCDLLLMAVLST